MNCWRILGIDPTDNVREIKRAYAAKSKVVHPEEHPEEFRELHEAYETALRLAKEGRVKVNRAASASTSMRAPKVEAGEDDLFGGMEAEAQSGNEGGLAAESEEVSESAEDADDGLFDSLKGQREPEAEPETSAEEESALEDDLGFDEAMESAYEEYKQYLISTTQRILGKLEVLACMVADKSKDEWKKVIQTEEFVNVARAEFFIYHLTQFVKEHDDLPKHFYKALVETMNFKELSTREQKGMYEELYNICVERGMYKPNMASTEQRIGYGIAGVVIAAQALARGYRAFDVDNPTIAYIIIAVVLIGTLALFLTGYAKKRGLKGMKEDFKYRMQSLFALRRFLNPKYVIANRAKPMAGHYIILFIIFAFIFALFMEIELWWLSFIFLILSALCALIFVYMMIMHIIVGILCVKDRKKK